MKFRVWVQIMSILDTASVILKVLDNHNLPCKIHEKHDNLRNMCLEKCGHWSDEICEFNETCNIDEAWQNGAESTCIYACDHPCGASLYCNGSSKICLPCKAICSRNEHYCPEFCTEMVSTSPSASSFTTSNHEREEALNTPRVDSSENGSTSINIVKWIIIVTVISGLALIGSVYSISWICASKKKHKKHTLLPCLFCSKDESPNENREMVHLNPQQQSTDSNLSPVTS